MFDNKKCTIHHNSPVYNVKNIDFDLFSCTSWRFRMNPKSNITPFNDATYTLLPNLQYTHRSIHMPL